MPTDLGVVYIAGPMRGKPLYNFPAFDAADDLLAGRGWETINPAKIDREQDGFDPASSVVQTSEFYMRRDLPLVAGADAIALLPGWTESDGARKEVTVALACGLSFLVLFGDGERPVTRAIPVKAETIRATLLASRTPERLT